MSLHKNLLAADIHVYYAFTYADAVARTGALGLVATDCGKVAWQLNENSFWVLVDHSPVTWVALSTTALEFNKVEIEIRKSTSGTLAKGKAVYAVGWDEVHNISLCELAKADSLSTMPVCGIVNVAATDTVSGKMMVVGAIPEIDTSAFTANALLYCSATTAGALTSTPPSGPNVLQTLGFCIVSDATHGVIGNNTWMHRPVQYITVPAALGTAACGTSNQASASDHVHPHGDLAGNSFHSAATGSTAGFESAADKTKLDGITVDAAAGTGSLRTIGTGALQACAGNDSRLSDGRTDANAIHKNVSAEISTVTEKTTPVAADLLLIEDSAASNAKKKLQVGHLPSSTYKQSVFGDIAVDTTSTSTVWADLLSVSITTGANFILVRASASLSNSNSSKNMFLRLVIDGVAKRAALSRTSALDVAEGFSLCWRQAVTAAAHTVKLQWMTDSNTIQCRPVTVPDQEHCSLLVEEVTA